jgi:multidrug efflux system membrane fusion protein
LHNDKEKMDTQDKTPPLSSPATTVPPTTLAQRRRRTIISVLIAVVAMAALGGLAWYLTQPAGNAGGPPGAGAGGGPGGPGGPGGGGGRRGAPASTVGVAVAETADIPVVLDALGTVTAAANVTVRPQVSGVLLKVLFQEGQMVKAGQVLAQIDPRQFENALLQASGQRQRDEAQLDNARLILERDRTLLSQDSIARQEVDTQAALVKQLEGTLMTDRAAEATARLNLGYTKVISPITGRVGLRTVDIGNVVNSGDAAGIAVVTQLAPIDVVFAVPQDQVPTLQARVAEGGALPAIALDRTRTNTLEAGRFLAMDNQVDVQTGTVRAKARFVNAKGALFPSQFVNLRLEVRTIKNAVMVPVTALRHGSAGDFVYVLNAADRTVSLRQVTRGQSTVDKIEVAKGLKVGEQVITEGADRLKDGAKVVLPGDKPAMGGGRDGKGGGRGRDGKGGGRGAGAPDGASAAAAASAASDAAPASSEPGARRRNRGSAQ